MSGNSRGGRHYRGTTSENKWRAFDRLPKEVRQALANAARNYAPQPFATLLRRGASPERVVQVIEQSDRLYAERDEIQRRRAVGIYRGNAPVREPRQ
jgi:hypothetical protein